MEMSRIEPNTYSFVTKDGYEHMAVMMEEGKYKGVAWGYTKIHLPQAEDRVMQDYPLSSKYWRMQGLHLRISMRKSS